MPIPDSYYLTIPVSDLIAGVYASAETDMLAAGLSDSIVSVLQPGTTPGGAFMSFLDMSDRYAFAAAFVAAELATPLPDIVEMSLSDFIVWHRQAARLAAGDFVSATILEGAPCAA